MREEILSSTVHPQIAHKLSKDYALKNVNKLWIRFVLLHCNDKVLRVVGLYERGFLPTMKLQLSQLP